MMFSALGWPLSPSKVTMAGKPLFTAGPILANPCRVWVKRCVPLLGNELAKKIGELSTACLPKLAVWIARRIARRPNFACNLVLVFIAESTAAVPILDLEFLVYQS